MENNTDVVFWLWGARMFFLFHIKIKIIIIILSQTHHSLLTPSVVGWNGLTFHFLSVYFRWTCRINSMNGSGEGHKNGMLENPQSQIHSQMMTIKLHFIISYTYILFSSPCLPLLFLLDRDSEKYVIFLFIIFSFSSLTTRNKMKLWFLFLFWFC